jgi:hypothetical protein
MNFKKIFNSVKLFFIDIFKTKLPEADIKPPESNSKPYVYYISNDGDTEQEAILYGYAKYSREENFGSGKDIKIISQNDTSYIEHLITSSIKIFEIGLIKIACNNEELFKSDVKIEYRDINGRRYIDLVPIESFALEGRLNKDIVDMHYPIKIDCNTHLIIKVPPKTKFVINIFPSKIWDSSVGFYGITAYKCYKIPPQILNPPETPIAFDVRETVEGIQIDIKDAKLLARLNEEKSKLVIRCPKCTTLNIIEPPAPDSPPITFSCITCRAKGSVFAANMNAMDRNNNPKS